MKKVLLVGSLECGKFIVDRAYSVKKLKKAKVYCDSRSNNKISWAIYLAPLEKMYINWSMIYLDGKVR